MLKALMDILMYQSQPIRDLLENRGKPTLTEGEFSSENFFSRNLAKQNLAEVTEFQKNCNFSLKASAHPA